MRMEAAAGHIGLGDRDRNAGAATFYSRVGQNAQQTGGLMNDYSRYNHGRL